MRPIDADKLLECVEASMLNNTHRNGNAALCHVSEHRHFIETIVEQPTAFDVENVVSNLEQLKLDEACNYKGCADCQYLDKCWDGEMREEHAMDIAIEIVKRGGLDES